MHIVTSTKTVRLLSVLQIKQCGGLSTCSGNLVRWLHKIIPVLAQAVFHCCFFEMVFKSEGYLLSPFSLFKLINEELRLVAKLLKHSFYKSWSLKFWSY